MLADPLAQDADLITVSPEASRNALTGPQTVHIAKHVSSNQLALACDELQAALRAASAERLQAGIRNLVQHMAAAPQAADVDQV